MKTGKEHHNFIHGKTKTKEDKAYRQMIARCFKTSHPQYSFYGGRGITVCERWINSRIAFFEDMGVSPSSEHSLDRIDVNGNYEPENCRWATKMVQNNNRRNNLNILFDNRTQSLSMWCRELGLFYSDVYSALKSGKKQLADFVK